MIDDRVKVNSIVQINENGQDGWIGCLVQVDDVRPWGIQGWVQIPKSGQAFIRVEWGQMDYVGEAVMKPKND